MKTVILLCLTIVLTVSCNVNPQPIAYGVDACHNCSMTIVDQQHAAQFVTKKGKCYKFDATECMLQTLSEFEKEDIALYRVADYSEPGKLIDATGATYIISSNIPSPMRGNISALFSDKEAEKLKQSHTGEVYTWEELQNRNYEK